MQSAENERLSVALVSVSVSVSGCSQEGVVAYFGSCQ